MSNKKKFKLIVEIRKRVGTDSNCSGSNCIRFKRPESLPEFSFHQSPRAREIPLSVNLRCSIFVLSFH